MPFTFSMTRSDCWAMSPASISPDLGSSAIWPETNRNPLARTACEYGPMGFGPRSVNTRSLMVGLLWKTNSCRLRAQGAILVASRKYPPRGLHSENGTPPERPDVSSTDGQIARRSGAFPARRRRLGRRDRTHVWRGRRACGRWHREKPWVRNDPARRKRTKSFWRAAPVDLHYELQVCEFRLHRVLVAHRNLSRPHFWGPSEGSDE